MDHFGNGRASLIRAGFYLSALANIGGILLFSLGLTNARLSALYPGVFSTFGLTCIMLWGLLYIAVARNYERVPELLVVFVLEKLLYVASWLAWMARFADTLPGLWAESPITAAFYVIYGPNDFAFGVFFAYLAWTVFRQRRMG